MSNPTMWSNLGKRVDHLGLRMSIGIGTALGASVGAASLLPFASRENAWPALATGAVGLAATWWLAHTAQPVGVAVPTFSFEHLELIPIQGGKFWMGSPETEEGRFDNEGPLHEVELSDFALAKLPTTQALYERIMGKNPGRPKGAKLPVNNVSFLDAIEFCNRRSATEGLERCYRVSASEIVWDRRANGYRLPTEAEWEYAARAGTRTRYYFGDDEAKLDEHAWYSESIGSELEQVGTKLPNPWGLHDLYGNVWEWCWDVYGVYVAEQQRDPALSSKRQPAAGSSSGRQELAPLVVSPAGGLRVLRGGSIYGARFLRSAYRFRLNSDDRNWSSGFRCARGSRRQSG